MTSYKMMRLVGITSVMGFSLVFSLFNATVAEAASISIQSLSPGNTVLVGQTLTFTAFSSADLGTSPTYLVFDDKSNSTLSSSAMNATSSAFSWTPSTIDLGRHTLSVEATDGKGMIAIFNLLITVATTTDTTSTNSTATTAVTTNSTSASSAIPLGSPVASSLVTTPQTTVQSTVSTSISSQLTSLQNTAISALLRAFGVSENLIGQVLALLSGNVSSTQTISNTSSVSSGNYMFTSLLSEGSGGVEVTELQKRLTALGYFSGTPSGYFGPQTTAAVKAFQKARGISPAGYVGPSTRTALNGQ